MIPRLASADKLDDAFPLKSLGRRSHAPRGHVERPSQAVELVVRNDAGGTLISYQRILGY